MYTCLMYHEVVTPLLHKFSVEPSQFEKQISSLADAGVESYILGDIVNPRKHKCLLTFDDGHVSNLQAARMLSELGFVGYFYLIKDYSLEREDYLSERDIKEISSLGHILGVHGKNHDQWAKMPEDMVISHLRETKDWIEQLTGKVVCTCSAPGGVIDNRTIDLIKREIPELKYIRTSRYGVNHEDDTVLNAVGVRRDYSEDKVLRLALNNEWEMKKVMTYYHIKEFLKPFYHMVKP